MGVFNILISCFILIIYVLPVGSFVIPVASDWIEARTFLENPSTRAVNVDVGKQHLLILRDYLIAFDSLDLRRKISVKFAQRDCLEITQTLSEGRNEAENVVEALAYIVQGGACFFGSAQEVMLRVVCDRDYIAKCPNFHVDKVSARGIVTILGEGTEFLLDSPGDVNMSQIHQASELDFLFMKGTHWKAPKNSIFSQLFSKQQHHPLWHRSPIDKNGKGHHRVIITVDACCDDEKEWLLKS